MEEADIERQVQQEVKKKKPMRTPAQEAATLKALQALKERREAIAREKIEKQNKKAEDVSSSVPSAPPPATTPAPAPVAAPMATPEPAVAEPKQPRKRKTKAKESQEPEDILKISIKQILDETLDAKLSKLMGGFSESKAPKEVKEEKRSTSKVATPPPPPVPPAPQKLTGHALLDKLFFNM